MKKMGTLGGLVVGIAIGAVVAWSVALASEVDAQSTARDVDMVAGPGGMWILSGGSVRVCTTGVQAGLTPATPRCGDPTPLR